MDKHKVIVTSIENMKASRASKKTPLVLWALILFMFISVGRIQELIPGLEKLYLGKVCGFIMIGTYLVFAGKKNRISPIEFPVLVCILGILFLGMLSIPFSVWPRYSLEFALNFLLGNVLFFYIVANTLTTIGRMRKTVYGLLIAVAVLSIIALTGQVGVSRISASQTYDPNDIAAVLLCMLPFAVFGFFEEKGIKKILLLLGVGLMIATVIFTYSRGGFIGILVVGGVILLRTLKTNKLLTGFIFIALIAVFSIVIPSNYWERMETIVEPADDYNVSSPAGRIEIWKKGLQFMIENPVTGVGIGSFATAEGLSHKNIGGKWSAAHNSFVQIGGELGVGGLILFILLFYYLFKSLRKMISKDPKINTLKESLRVSLIAYIVGGFFLSQAYSVILYLIAAIIIALTCIIKRSDLNQVWHYQRDHKPPFERYKGSVIGSTSHMSK